MKCDRAFSQRNSLRTHELSHQCGLIHNTYELPCTSQKQHPCMKCLVIPWYSETPYSFLRCPFNVLSCHLQQRSPCNISTYFTQKESLFFLNNLFRRNKFWKFCKDCFGGMEFLQHFNSKKRILPIFHNSHVVNKWLRKSNDSFNVMPCDTLWGLFCFGRHDGT